ncbi:EpsG family protein [Sporosarcina sp. BP05]|uniref:EpsG family protein n=1 Tax=Sporosarcina sp. BP05 TaxID=2758726 RepID=UPI001648F3FE|nr:EpsG family protein [Sporosarcina sp. BP05]
MLVYTINLIYTTIANYLSRIITNKIISTVLSVSALFCAVLVAGLRYGVGTDYHAYEQWFSYYLSNSVRFDEYQDIGFALMVVTLQLFTDNPQSLFLVSALITISLVIKFIKNNTDIYDLGFFLFITLYLYYSGFNIMRQWIAISIFLYSLKYAFDKKYYKYILFVLLASSFHTSALLMLPLYFILNFKINKKNISILIIISSLLAFFFEELIVNLAKLLPFLNLSKYTLYFDSIYATSGGGGWAYSVILIGTFILMYLNGSKYKSNIKYGNQHFSLMIFAAVFSLFAPYNMIFSRIQLFLMPIAIVCLPNLVKIQTPKQRVLMSFLIITLGLLYMYRALIINGGEPLPYDNILFK